MIFLNSNSRVVVRLMCLMCSHLIKCTLVKHIRSFYWDKKVPTFFFTWDSLVVHRLHLTNLCCCPLTWIEIYIFSPPPPHFNILWIITYYEVDFYYNVFFYISSSKLIILIELHIISYYFHSNCLFRSLSTSRIWLDFFSSWCSRIIFASLKCKNSPRESWNVLVYTCNYARKENY